MTLVAVVGPGAIGATVAAAVRGEVALYGRTPHDRLLVEREGGGTQVVPGPVVTDPAAARPADVVLLAVKAHQTEAAAPFLRALCHDRTVVVELQNGVEQRELVGPHVGGATVLPAIVWVPVEGVGPGHVRVRGDVRLTLPDEPAAHDVAELIDGVELAADFLTLLWRKLAINAVAGLMVLAGRRAGMFRRPDVAALARALAAETLAVARAEGADLPDSVADELVAEFAAYPEDLGSSILFDHEAGRPLEWDARNGVVERLGARHGVPTPVSAVIVPLLAASSAYRSGVPEEASEVADRDAIVRVALDYFEGWFDGDAARMERALHPDLAKRSPDDAPAPGELEKLTAPEMIEATAKGIGKTRDVPDRGLEVEVEHVHREIANVTVRSAVYVEYLHLVRTRDGWKIVNALWQHP